MVKYQSILTRFLLKFLKNFEFYENGKWENQKHKSQFRLLPQELE
jgi:hypothetical protein